MRESGAKERPANFLQRSTLLAALQPSKSRLMPQAAVGLRPGKRTPE